MCEPTTIAYGIAAVLAVAGGVQTARAQSAAAEAQAQADETNARIGRTQAEQARQIGNMEEERQMRRVRAAVATQRATQAANGLDVNSGTALDLQAETAGFGAADALNLRSNAIRQAWGFEVGAVNDINSASAARAAGSNAATGTLLTTAGQVAGMYGSTNGFGMAGRGGGSGVNIPVQRIQRTRMPVTGFGG